MVTGRAPGWMRGVVNKYDKTFLECLTLVTGTAREKHMHILPAQVRATSGLWKGLSEEACRG